MAEIVACPNCQRQLQIPENFLGQAVQCPECRHQFVANAVSNAVQSAAPALTQVSPKRKADEDADERPRRRRRFEDENDDDDYDDRPYRRQTYLAPHRGPVILTFAIIGIFVAPLIIGPLAWIMGSMDLRAMREGRMDPEGETQTRIGRNIARVMVCLYVLLLVGLIGFLIVTDHMR